MNYVITITHILQIKGQKWAHLCILRIIDDGVFICTHNISSPDKTKKPDMHLFTEAILYKKNYGCVTNFDNISHAPICVLEEEM